MIRRTLVPGLLTIALGITPTRAADLWHLPGWHARAVVEIAQPLPDTAVDTAAARVLCQGRAKPDGSDYRVLDAAGKPVPFQLTSHDAGRYSLVAFRAEHPRPHQRFYIYFDNPQAARAPEQVVDNPAPGSGPPKGSWVPHAGLVLQTIQRPEGDNPQSVEDMAKLIAASPYRHGGRYQRRIADGYNPFGSSDYYISIYRGWINVPKAGSYQFCTASNEASFSFLDGKPLVHWPGRHTAERGMHGEKNARVELTAGLHYVEYYHEEVTLEQMAFLGWRPAGEPAFGGIPESVYTAPHTAQVVAYEDPKGPLLHFEPLITDSVWPTERHESQYTRCRFRAGTAPAPSAGTTYRWDFGDGQTAAGPDAEHVYLALGRYQVSLTAQGPQGTATARWPLEVFEIEQVTDEFKEGRPRDYARLAKQYDRGKLDAAALTELAYLLAESEEPAAAIDAGKEFERRFGPTHPRQLSRVRRLIAESALRLGKDNVDEAIANYQASITNDTPPAEKLDVLARLIRLVGIERNLPDRTGAFLGQVEETARGAKPDDDTRAAYRRAVIAAGDVLLWQGKLDGATDLYRRAEALRDFIPSQVRAARVGSYPNALRDLIGGGNYGAALDLLDRWEEMFPTDKPKGQTFFWRGKVCALRGQPREAARYLARAIGLATGAGFEPEARWLLAESLEQLGRAEDARKELARLVALGGTDVFTKKARSKLEEGLGPGRQQR
jgi:tetratricopeptide (TPR) repeat protein